jgi:hypothetical protein
VVLQPKQSLNKKTAEIDEKSDERKRGEKILSTSSAALRKM